MIIGNIRFPQKLAIYFFINSKNTVKVVIEMKLEEKINALMKYRNALSKSDQQVFDVLVNYAKEELRTLTPVSANI